MVFDSSLICLIWRPVCFFNLSVLFTCLFVMCLFLSPVYLTFVFMTCLSLLFLFLSYQSLSLSWFSELSLFLFLPSALSVSLVYLYFLPVSLWPISLWSDLFLTCIYHPFLMSFCRHLLCSVKDTLSTGLMLSQHVTYWVPLTHWGLLLSRFSFIHILYDVTFIPPWLVTEVKFIQSHIKLRLYQVMINSLQMVLFCSLKPKLYSVCSSWPRFWPTVRSWQWVIHQHGAKLLSESTYTL